MQFTIVAALTMALGALGAPQLGGPPNTRIPPVPGDVTVGQAGDTCGSDLDLSCCDKVDQSGDAINTAEGLLAGLLEGGLEDATVGLFDGCSKLNVAAVVGLDDLLNSQCKQTPACCQHSGMEQEGLLNVGLPCLALGSVL
ncbi:hypothetical protein F4815DRAFT_435501 [Daldinia loculata]|uniref:uncharacterized protein n=1 Tax=Daldinia loculata TaxID=103429 RepID=UPI0020C2C606|nr:uncharacterized protein F4817DRAFT_105135 [Daldinia loculata]KAI1647308.1 hypothetical protein F4817DRAFT_105135 [Daldinia loculata]KAI2770444.1 hypothetical protein F4815DRAFT_435501 [Daldinia loculata]